MGGFDWINRVLPAWVGILLLHGLWLRSSTKWTSFLWFFPVFAGLVFALTLLMLLARRRGGLLMRLMLGAASGYIACTVAWLIADAFTAPQRLGIAWEALQSTPARFVADTAFTTTITGCWFVGALLGGAAHLFSRQS
jgi:hypothetical protein